MRNSITWLGLLMAVRVLLWEVSDVSLHECTHSRTHSSAHSSANSSTHSLRHTLKHSLRTRRTQTPRNALTHAALSAQLQAHPYERKLTIYTLKEHTRWHSTHTLGTCTLMRTAVSSNKQRTTNNKKPTSLHTKSTQCTMATVDLCVRSTVTSTST